MTERRRDRIVGIVAHPANQLDEVAIPRVIGHLVTLWFWGGNSRVETCGVQEATKILRKPFGGARVLEVPRPLCAEQGRSEVRSTEPDRG